MWTRRLNWKSALPVGLAMVTCAVVLVDRPTASARHDGDAVAADALDDFFEIVGSIMLGVRDGRVVSLPAIPSADGPLSLTLPIEGQELTLDLVPHSTRSADYRVLAQRDDGSLEPVESEPAGTMRGEVRGRPGSRVALSLVAGGLEAMIDLGDGERHFLEPLERVLPDAGDRHLLYAAGDVLPQSGACGSLAAAVKELPPAGGGDAGGGVAGVGPQCAQLACDADYEYFLDYGSVAAVEARINSVVNTVNLQYEAEVGLTHQITTIIVRTAEPDPYSSNIASTMLSQLQTHWNANHADINRDVVQLFTGKTMSVGTIGLAFQGTVCDLDQAYCFVQSDYNGSFAFATDLSAHELGHTWNAAHCTCTSNTMNAIINGANTFSAASITAITSYRDGVSCLADQCPTGGVPTNDLCADAEPFNGGAGDGVIFFDTNLADTDGPLNPPGTCADNGENQTWHDIWYTYTATCSGALTVTTCDDLHGQGAPDFDTDLVVYGPYASVAAIDCGNLVLAGCNDDDTVNPCGSSAFSSTVDLAVDGGDVYLIRVGGWSSADEGTGWLSVSCSGTPVPTEACCLPGGGCQQLTTADCAAQGGTALGPGSTCDSDGDGTPDCTDGCPNDPAKTDPGDCGCGVPDTPTCGDIINLASADFATPRGVIVSGSFQSTHVQDDVVEHIQEEIQGNPTKGKSLLEHVWAFSVEPGYGYTFFIDAWRTLSDDDDQYELSYSTDNASWTPMLTVSKTADDDVLQSFTLPPTVSGTLYVQAVDTNRSKNTPTLDSLFVDEMYIVTNTTPPTTMTVTSIVVTDVGIGQGRKIGHAEVTVMDDYGAPVSGVGVTGTFTGNIEETVGPIMTDASGVAVLETVGWDKGKITIQFCVDGVTGGSLTYVPPAPPDDCATN